MKPNLINLLIAIALLPAPALANPTQAKAPAAEKADATAKATAAQAEIEQLVKRIEVLSKDLAEETDVRIKVIRQPGGESMPQAGKRMIHIERMQGGPPAIGIGIVMAPHADKGVRIAAVTPEGPAAKAGLQVGDILLSVDGKTISGKQSEALDNARKLLANLTQDQALKIGYHRDGKSHTADVRAGSIRKIMLFSENSAPWSPEAHALAQAHVVIDPAIRMEIARSRGEMARARAAMHCPPDADCELPALAQAFRWHGLNLAPVDAKLGRYFGTDKGVLVLNGSTDLSSLEPGDVILSIAGQAVSSPREAMRALRERDAGSKVSVELMRDRSKRKVDVIVPEVPPMHWFAPPPPPAPPAPPAPPKPPVHPPV